MRRRLVEVLVVGEHRAGVLTELAGSEFGRSRTAVSHQLRTLRNSGVVRSSVDAEDPRSRSYRLDPAFLAALDSAVFELVELREQRYGSTEERPPSMEGLAVGLRLHRFGEAERRRRLEMLAEWLGTGETDPSDESERSGDSD